MSTVIKHSGDKALYTFFDPTNTQWPVNIVNVQEALALIGSWARTDTGLPVASDSTPGIAQIATLDEVNAGTDNSKIVTPYLLQSRLNRPEATYTTLGLTQYATIDEAMQTDNEVRTIVPKQLHEVLTRRVATEAISGTAKIATTSMATSGVDDTTIMSPLKVKQAITALVPSQAIASESVMGISKLATAQEALEGNLREGISISPYAFSRANASETKFGTAKLASAQEMKSDNTAVVTAARFRNQRASTGEIGTTQLTNVLGNPSMALSGVANVVNRAGDNMSGRLQLNGIDYIVRTELERYIPQVGFIMMSAYESHNNWDGVWMYCDGRWLNKYQYATLFSRIGFTYGGDGGDNFALPNFQNIFPRGAAPGRRLGYREDDTMQRITAQWTIDDQAAWSNYPPVGAVWADNAGSINYDASSDNRRWRALQMHFDSARQTRTSDETRPKNMAIHFIIRVS